MVIRDKISLYCKAFSLGVKDPARAYGRWIGARVFPLSQKMPPSNFQRHMEWLGVFASVTSHDGMERDRLLLESKLQGRQSVDDYLKREDVKLVRMYGVALALSFHVAAAIPVVYLEYQTMPIIQNVTDPIISVVVPEISPPAVK